MQSRCAWSSMSLLYSLKTLKLPVRQAYCSLWTRLGVEEVVLALRAILVLPADVERLAVGRPLGEGVVVPRLDVLAAITSRPMPPTRDGVPVKYLSMTSLFRPIASKIWAPQ